MVVVVLLIWVVVAEDAPDKLALIGVVEVVVYKLALVGVAVVDVAGNELTAGDGVALVDVAEDELALICDEVDELEIVWLGM